MTSLHQNESQGRVTFQIKKHWKILSVICLAVYAVTIGYVTNHAKTWTRAYCTLIFKSRSKLSALLCLAACAAFAFCFGSNSATSSMKERPAVVVRAGVGRGLLNPHDGLALKVEYGGDAAMSEALRTGSARPLALATGDFDGDGTPDLVSGYSHFGEGIITLQRGNPDAFAPEDESVYARMQRGYNPESLLPTAETYQVPEPVDFVQAGGLFSSNSVVSDRVPNLKSATAAPVTVRAEGRGKAFLNLRDGKELPVAYSGEERFIEPLRKGSARPLTLASADFNADGFPDLVCGYASPNGGLVTLQLACFQSLGDLRCSGEFQ